MGNGSLKSYRTYIIIISLLFAAYVVTEYYKPKPVDWNETYINKDKIPYGTFVLYDVMKDIFPGERIDNIREPVYNHLQKYYYYSENDNGEQALFAQSDKKYNYIFISPHFETDTLDLPYMLHFVGDGNNVFIASKYFRSKLLDTLNLEQEYAATLQNDSVSVKLNDENPVGNYSLKKSDIPFYFRINDSANTYKTEILASADSGHAIFIRVLYGKGYFYFCTAPAFFSNIMLLSKNNNDFAFRALSYLPVNEIFWDEYQKQGREGDDSLFRAVLSNAPLRWSYYITLGAIVMFIFFEAKRRQRIIPVIEPLSNSTLEFVRTLGNLYLSKGDHKNIALKKVQYFFDFIRERYRLSTTEINDELVKAIADKSGFEKDFIDDIFRMINFVQYNDSTTEKSLLDFNSLLEKFYKSAA